ncbi:carbohydrate-binding protein [Desulfoscipio gibsoniae]|uniref:Carbohydrate binding domain (Family 25) n=1 Tax=Desulfoscipio gibsoniae DSM 7213 TaxID=767817 RepID=R4KP92_9FIRM|nr:carbohydrate-binding protein [Desulfoscipio gibsoniae]AGL01456.1 Carbohydrate binding domain (family 25) [Desulfoscipio gibsoniae DSM 7213]
MSTLSPFTFSSPIQGVQVKPLKQDGKEIRIRYSGMLNKNGANQVWMHAGIGEVEEWVDSKDYLMEKTSEGWEHTVDVKGKQFNFCFRDDAHNWDNNNGTNWIYRIT